MYIFFLSLSQSTNQTSHIP